MYKKNTNAGFTLIELLATITIISILTLIAIPQYTQYRARGYDTVAQVDLRNVAIAEEAYFFDAERYLACENEACSQLPGISNLSNGVSLSMVLEGESDFRGEAIHQRGTGRTMRWSSGNGGMQ